jgi:hypothetical protein
MTAVPVVTAARLSVDGPLVVADPCYIDQDDAPAYTAIDRGLAVSLPEATGEWHVEYEQNAGWGERVTKLIARREGASVVREERVGDNGVDSGQMYIGPRTALPLDYDALLKQHEASDWKLDFQVFGDGVVSSTGVGDGLYPVTVGYDADGRPAEVTVEFLPDFEEAE